IPALLDLTQRHGFHVTASGTVTRLAAHPELRRLNPVRGSERYRAGGMTLETGEYASERVHGFVLEARRQRQCIGTKPDVAGSGRQRLDGGVIREVVLDVPVLVQAADEGDGLLAGAERPFHGNMHRIFAIEYAGLESSG